MDYEDITIAILVKDKAHCLPTYLQCILNQTYPKNNTYIYIRSNNNKDNSSEILSNWVKEYGFMYKEIYEDYSDVEQNVQQYSPHEWNSLRFKVLGKIRQDSIQWALDHNSHYFVVDCDNFIYSFTLENLFKARVPIIGPLLRTSNTVYSNFHETCDKNGYYLSSDAYFFYLNQKVKQIVGVDVIHCCYLIRKEYIPFLTYDDNSCRHEYVIFSHSARKNNIAQFLDTRELYGHITFKDTLDELITEPWLYNFPTPISTPTVIPNGKIIISPQAGFCNRIRALASGISVGLRECKEIFYTWQDCNTSVVINLNHFSAYFDEIIPQANLPQGHEIDQILTEWLPGDEWYNEQSGAQRQYPRCKDVKRITNFYNGRKKNILLETSLRLDVNNQNMMDIYRDYFKPKQRFMDYINSISDVDVGISIRRGSHLKYFPQYTYTFEQYIEWIRKNFTPGTKICLFSCDWSFRDSIKDLLKDEFTFVENTFVGEKWEIAFIEFLILSFKCNKIYGTPLSSFCEEAGLFGGKKHCTPILI